MTTIAFHKESNTVAVDSRCTTAGGMITSDSDIKHYKTEHGIFIMSGIVADIDDFILSYPVAASLVYECDGILIKDNKAFYVCQTDTGEFLTQEMRHSKALGSGGQFALAAMDFGCDARGAVKYAMKRDANSGGRIKVFRVK